MEKRYTVGQAVELTGVKSYVLRYWEEELGLFIHRNELGHRYYTGYDIRVFLTIKELKERGLQLRAIKDAISNFPETSVEIVDQDGDTKEQSVDNLLQIPLSTEQKALEPTSLEGHADVHSEKIVEFQQIMERLIAQEMKLKNSDEVRCRKIDEAIRRQQNARREAAVTSEKGKRKNFFKT